MSLRHGVTLFKQRFARSGYALICQRHFSTIPCRERLRIMAWSHHAVRAPPQSLPRLPPGPRRLSTASSAVLSNTTSFLRNLHNGAEIFVVGTAHVSKRSAEEVREMLRLVKPKTVLVELCPQRAARLRASGADDPDFLKNTLGALFGSGGSFSQKLVAASLPMMYRALRLLGMDPGAEFKAALEEADRLGARVVYGDRDVQRTLGRLAEAADLQQMLRMASGSGMPEPPAVLQEFFMRQSGGGLESQVEAMKTRQVVQELAAYMRRVNPQLAAALIDERDDHMVAELSRLSGRCVAVVGLAHLPGIERRWEELQYGRRALAPR